MKKIYAAGFGLLVFLQVSCQNPIQNPGFETWTDSTDATSWTCHKASQTAQSHSGAYAIKVTVKNNGDVAYINGGNASIQASKNYDSLQFSYIFNQVDSDELFVSLQGLSLGILITQIVRSITTGTPAYVTVSWPIQVLNSGTAVNYSLGFSVQDQSGGNNTHAGSYFIIDDVGLTDATSAISDPIRDALDFAISPNPSASHFSIHLNTANYHNLLLQIYDICGRSVKTQSLAEFNTQIDAQDLSEGAYIVAIRRDDAIVTKKLEIVR